MRTIILLLSILVFSGTVWAEKKMVLTGHPDAVQVLLPEAKFTVRYVEAAEGMMVYVESQGVKVKGRIVFIGDGQFAVPFEARHDGFFLPEGERNVSGVEYESNATIKFTKGKRRAWAEKAGDVYVLSPGITLEELK